MKNRLVSWLIRMVSLTWNIRIHGTPPRTSGVCAFWHGEMLAVWKYFSRTGTVGVTSKSRDGAMLAQLLQDWGYMMIRGSSSQGGSEVLEAMTLAASERVVLVTPDGPRGPRGKFKAGAVVAAQRASVPLFQCTVTCACCYRLRSSWDLFMIPLPFARIDIHFKEPVEISKGSSPDQIDKLLRSLSQSL